MLGAPPPILPSSEAMAAPVESAPASPAAPVAPGPNPGDRPHVTAPQPHRPQHGAAPQRGPPPARPHRPATHATHLSHRRTSTPLPRVIYRHGRPTGNPSPGRLRSRAAPTGDLAPLTRRGTPHQPATAAPPAPAASFPDCPLPISYDHFFDFPSFSTTFPSYLSRYEARYLMGSQPGPLPAAASRACDRPDVPPGIEDIACRHTIDICLQVISGRG
jgi:hypothetical protein